MDVGGLPLHRRKKGISGTMAYSPGRYLLGIECDGATYHRAATARDRDKLRQLILEGLGWKLHRIWSTDWWHDANQEMGKLLGVLPALSEVKPGDN